MRKWRWRGEGNHGGREDTEGEGEEEVWGSAGARAGRDHGARGVAALVRDRESGEPIRRLRWTGSRGGRRPLPRGSGVLRLRGEGRGEAHERCARLTTRSAVPKMFFVPARVQRNRSSGSSTRATGVGVAVAV